MKRRVSTSAALVVGAAIVIACVARAQFFAPATVPVAIVAVPEDADGEAHEADDDGDCLKCKEPSREPGDDTETIRADRAKRRASGKEVVTPAQRREVRKAFGVVVQFVEEKLKRKDVHAHLQAILAAIEGASC